MLKTGVVYTQWPHIYMINSAFFYMSIIKLGSFI